MIVKIIVVIHSNLYNSELFPLIYGESNVQHQGIDFVVEVFWQKVSAIELLARVTRQNRYKKIPLPGLEPGDPA